MSHMEDAMRCRETAEDIREFLRGMTGPRDRMYHGLQHIPENFDALCALLDSHMRLLGKLVGKDWREFGVVARWGPTGMHKFLIRSESWEQNKERLHGWVNEFLDWLDNPLYQMAAALREDDEKD